MLSLKKKMLMAGGARLRPQDVFATSLYTGNGGTQTITNGLNLAGKGGLVWLKSRSTADDHYLYDTSRGAGLALKSQSTQAEENNGRLSAFLSNGFTLNSPSAPNQSGVPNVAWTWREARKFFVKVTYTGNGQSGRQIPHGLGDVPGMIVVKARSRVENWQVWHRASPNALYLNLVEVGSALDKSNTIPAVSSSTFTVGGNSYSSVNEAGQTYVAYLFAHNPELIDCGSYTGTLRPELPVVTCGTGWKPQFLLLKDATSRQTWLAFDDKRSPNNARTNVIQPCYPEGEVDNTIYSLDFTATGFQPKGAAGAINVQGGNFVYLAIRSPT